jgi:hypothetical protein
MQIIPSSAALGDAMMRGHLENDERDGTICDLEMAAWDLPTPMDTPILENPQAGQFRKSCSF